jgi:hypothetical protein
LYLDSSDWSIYRDTRNGAFSRFKLRARCYTFEPSAPIFLEVKSREGESMRKTRAVLSHEEAVGLLWQGRPPRKSNPELENFRMWTDRREAVPRLWVTYRRFAFVARNRDLVRVTFDDEIACAPPTLEFREPSRWYGLPEVRGVSVLELKYHGSYPGWIADLVRRFGLERRAMSRYRHGVDLYRIHKARMDAAAALDEDAELSCEPELHTIAPAAPGAVPGAHTGPPETPEARLGAGGHAA